MNGLSTTPIVDLIEHEKGLLRKYWKWFMALGVAMVVLGTIAMSWSCIATITVAAT